MSINKFDNLLGWEINNKINIYISTLDGLCLVSYNKKTSDKYKIMALDYNNESIEDILSVDYIGNDKVKLSSYIKIDGVKKRIYYSVDIEDYLNVLKSFGTKKDLKTTGEFIFCFLNKKFKLIPKCEENALYKEYKKYKEITNLKEKAIVSSKITKANLKAGNVYKDIEGNLYLIYGLFYKKVGEKSKRVIVSKYFQKEKHLINFQDKNIPFDKNNKYLYEDAYTSFETMKFVEDLGQFFDFTDYDVLKELNNMYSIENVNVGDYFSIGGKYNYPIGLMDNVGVKKYIIQNKELNLLKLKKHLIKLNDERATRSYEYFKNSMYENINKYTFYSTKKECDEAVNFTEEEIITSIMKNINLNLDTVFIYYTVTYSKYSSDTDIELKISANKEELEQKLGYLSGYAIKPDVIKLLSLREFLN